MNFKTTLERLAGKANRITRVLLFALSLLFPAWPSSAKAEVVFSIETANDNGFVTKSFANNTGRSILVNVYAESTETNDLKQLKWSVIPPADVGISSIIQPNPSYIGGAADFFYPYVMSSTVNYTGLEFNQRRVIAAPGPKLKKGLVGQYIFMIDANTPLGIKTFSVSNTEARDFNYEIQPSSGASASVEIIPAYTALYNNPKLFLEPTKLPDSSTKVPTLFLDTRVKNTRFVVEASAALGSAANWTPLKSNEVYNANSSTWIPFSFRDDAATNHVNRFYRARSL